MVKSEIWQTEPGQTQLAEEATPPASETGSQFSLPSSAFASADLPLLGEETVAEPMLPFEKPGLTEFRYKLQTQRDTSDWQFSPEMFQHYDTFLWSFQVDATCDNEGRNALCPEFWSQANSCTKHTWAGKSIWCNPPFDEVQEVLQQA